MALFTGKGDGGTTKVIDSKERILKCSELPEALGALDELNSFIGLAKIRAQSSLPTIAAILREAQETLFIVQAEVAGADKKVEEKKVKWLEDIVNAIEAEIPPITSFSIAGGTELSALLDVARTFARRAERRASALEAVGARELSAHTRAYLNRLSSLLFALARLANHKAGIAEENPRYE